MKAREHDLRRLDVEALAKEGATLSGQWPLAALARLAGSVHPEAAALDDAVRWELRGELRPVRGGATQVWLHLRADTRVALECQRCLQPVVVALDARRSFLFVAGEAQAAELDAEFDDDVLALTRSLDTLELVEDELLLALPLVPRHERCDMPEHAAAEPHAVPGDERPNPFAALEALKGRTRRH